MKEKNSNTKQSKKPTVAAGRIKFNLNQSEAAFLNHSQTAMDNDLAQFIQPVKNLVLICRLKAEGQYI